MTQIVRTAPPLAGDEAETLVAFLDYQRDTLRIKTQGLSAAQLDQRLEPSSVTLGGLLKHLAHVEDWWFNQVFAGNLAPEPWASVDSKADGDWEWRTAVEDTPRELRALFDETVGSSRRILATVLTAPGGLSAESALTSHHHPGRTFTLRWIIVHMLEEYARHNGHADLIRASIDGLVGQ